MEDDDDYKEVQADPLLTSALLNAVAKAPVADKVQFILFYGLCLCIIIFIGRHFANLAEETEETIPR